MTNAPTAGAEAPVSSPAGPVPVAHQDERAEAWMRAIFGDAYDPAHKHALARLRIFDYPKPYLMTLKSAARLPDGRFALVVGGVVGPDDSPASGDEDDMSRAYTAGRLSVYIVRQQAGDWEVVERHESLTSMESGPDRHALRWTTIGPGKPGFTMTTQYNGAPRSVTVIEVFELAHGARKLAELRQSANNDNDCTIESELCWNIEGTPRFADTAGPDGYADLVIDFRGKRYRYSEDDDTGMTIVVPIATIAQSARYRFDGKAYELLSGTNPVDTI